MEKRLSYRVQRDNRDRQRQNWQLIPRDAALIQFVRGALLTSRKCDRYLLDSSYGTPAQSQSMKKGARHQAQSMVLLHREAV
jgi:hypothetical protein